MKLSSKNYEQYLNEIGAALDEEEFIIGGKFRAVYYPNRYGKALKKHDPMAYNTGFNEWVSNNRRKW